MSERRVLVLLLLAGCSVLAWCPGMLLHLTVTFLLAGGPEEDVFVGRAAELARLADVLARVRRGQPWLVTIEGESGVGKTALARRSLAWPAGLRVLWARG